MTAKLASTSAHGPVTAGAEGGIPFDFASTRASDDWRAHFVWPTRSSVLRHHFEASETAYLAVLSELPGERQQRIAIMAAGAVLGRARPLIEAAITCRNAAVEGLRLVSEQSELGYLFGEIATPPPPRDGAWLNPAARPHWPLARRIARAATWTPAWRLPATLMAPHAVAVTHNALLRDVAEGGGRRIGFRHAETLLLNARRTSRAPIGDLHELVETITLRLMQGLDLEDPYRARLKTLLRRQVAALMTEAARDILAVETIPRLPDEIWTGTGGYPPSRALGLEVLRRGGEAVRFDHSGSVGLVRASSSFALRELAVSSQFVLAPPMVAQAVHQSNALNLVSGIRKTRIVAHPREPRLCALDLKSGPAGRARRKVVYAPTIFRGFFQTAFGIVPDPVYLDWQLRLVAHMLAMPVDVLCKPHPGGLLMGSRHPLESVAPTSYEPFEAIMGEADLFVFDRCQSTTFWTALCTERPVVLIDLGITEFEAAVRPILERRIRIVSANFDAANLPQVDTDELAEAISGGPDRVDPSEARALLAGGQYAG